MIFRRGATLGLLVVALLVAPARVAQASAIALSSITGFGLTVTSPSASPVLFDDFDTLAFAQAQNSLGQLAQFSDAQTNTASAANAAVVWADGHGFADEDLWVAASNANVPGLVNGAASSAGQGLWFRLLGFNDVVSPDPVSVTFTVQLSGLLSLQTDAAGQFAQSEVIFNLLIPGFDDPVLFFDSPHAIGPSSSLVQPFGFTLTNSISLDPTQDYFLILRVDSESSVLNQVPVPEPATLVLMGVGLFAARRFGRRSARRSSSLDKS